MEEYKEDIRFEMGSGERIRFWKDKGCRDHTLESVVPSLFNLARNKEAKVADYWVQMEGGGDWNVDLRRRLNDWEIIDMATLIKLINPFNLCPNRVDALRWFHVKRLAFLCEVL